MECRSSKNVGLAVGMQMLARRACGVWLLSLLVEAISLQRLRRSGASVLYLLNIDEN